MEGSRTPFPGKAHEQIMHRWRMSVFPGWVQGQSLWLRLFPCLPHTLASRLPPACSPRDRYTLQTLAEAYMGNALKAQEGIRGPLCLGITECQVWKGPQKASGPTLLIYEIGNRYRGGRASSTNSFLPRGPVSVSVNGPGRVALQKDDGGDEADRDKDGAVASFLPPAPN